MFNLKLNPIKSFKKLFFPFYKNKELKLIFQKLQDGFSEETVVSRFVGGCVRKHLNGEKIDDIDVATILTIDQIKEKLKDTKFKVIDTGIKHGTVTVVSDRHKLEITTLRRDVKTDGRHAEVEYIENWKLDSERRDFTINAIYLDINGNIFDPQMGTVDLQNNNIRFIGDPQKRIEEDYLRIIRFIRFKIMYDDKIESSTSTAIKLNLDGIKKISKERILIELLKILELKNIFNMSNNSNLKTIFSLIFPEFLYLDRLDRLKKVYKYSSLNKYILLAILLIDEKGNHEYFSHKYSVSNKIKESLEKFSTNLFKIKKNKKFFEKDILKNVYLNGKDHMIALNLINFSINQKIKFQEFSLNLKRILKIDIPKLDFNGEYLKQSGLKEGLLLGKVLSIIEKEWVENNFQISEDRVKELIRVHSN